MVDGGSSDGTVALARQAGAKVVTAPRGRGNQLDAGWRAAQGKWILFLHADSRLPSNCQQLMESSIAAQRSPPARWGCFSTIRTELSGLQGALLSQGVALRTRLFHQPYGDQAIFVERSALEQLGGLKAWCALRKPANLPALWAPVHADAWCTDRIDAWACVRFACCCAVHQLVFITWRCSRRPLLEDVELVSRLRRLSPPAIVNEALQTSARRWERLGLMRTALVNQVILAGYALGVDVNTLAAWYEATGVRRKRGVVASASSAVHDKFLAAADLLTPF